jgi:pseudouridine synthase, RluA family
MKRIVLTLNEAEVSSRIDLFVAERVSITRSASQKLLENGGVTVNNEVVSKNYKLRLSDTVTVTLPEPEKLDTTAEDIELDIVYEDDSIVIVNKPKGMVVHPAAGNYTGTLVNALLHHCGDSLSGINGVIRPGIVHRIDKDTSGLLAVAKTDIAHVSLAEQIKSHTLERKYHTIVVGNIKTDIGVIDAPIARHRTDRKKMAIMPDGRNAVTHYKVLERFDSKQRYTYLELKLETGRTHQIRVHMASTGHPVLGDAVYGKPFETLDGQCLHAKTLGIIHPVSGEYMVFDTELPPYFEAVLNKMRKINNE